MKVVSSKQMALLESQAYRDGASETDFMEEAGTGIALIVHDFIETYHPVRHVTLLCGSGNNGGDAYVAGINLLHLDYEVTAYQLHPINESSNLCRENHYRFVNEGGRVLQISNIEEVVFNSSVIIDGIFGTGFHGKVEEPIASVIEKANASKLPIIAVDIPTGLDGQTGIVQGSAIIATITAFLGLPKTGFFLNDGWKYVGKLTYVDFGLPKEYIETAEPDLIMLSPDMMQPVMPPIVRNRNKYQAGHVIGLAGSHNMPGAGILSSLSALRGGAGIVRLLHPEGMQAELAMSPYELIKVPYQYDHPEEIVTLMNQASATFVGPGLGKTPEVRKMLRYVLPKLTKPCVIDADALTILSEEDIRLPEHTVLTPHTGEAKRLMHLSEITINMDLLKKCQDYATEKNVTFVLKGGPTFIFQANQPMMVNPRGDPGMATAGSGDVLTGLIAALLAQGLSTHDAAALGVYLHGISGEFAADELTSYCMNATDIINFFPDAFLLKNWLK
jgi:ADP-dependent NAD(P)H-hydrate dehydratase / NAD(P)H-hydrate epimerase